QADVSITTHARVELGMLLNHAGKLHPSGEFRGSHAHIHSAYNSWARELPRVVDQAVFQQFLKDLPGSVVRAKGFVRFDGDAGTHYFNKVADSVQIAPLGGAGQPPAMIVCIGRRLEPNELDATLSRLSPDAPPLLPNAR